MLKVSRTQLFFHKFFNQKQERHRLKKDKVEKRKPGKGDYSDVENEVDSENHGEDSDSDKEAEIWKASPHHGWKD
jgi:ribosome biogenesis protein MAK21